MGNNIFWRNLFQNYGSHTCMIFVDVKRWHMITHVGCFFLHLYYFMFILSIFLCILIALFSCTYLIYILINDLRNHWYLAVFELKKWDCQLWNSNPPPRNDDLTRLNQVRKLVCPYIFCFTLLLIPFFSTHHDMH